MPTGLHLEAGRADHAGRPVGTKRMQPPPQPSHPERTDRVEGKQQQCTFGLDHARALAKQPGRVVRAFQRMQQVDQAEALRLQRESLLATAEIPVQAARPHPDVGQAVQAMARQLGRKRAAATDLQAGTTVDSGQLGTPLAQLFCNGALNNGAGQAGVVGRVVLTGRSAGGHVVDCAGKARFAKAQHAMSLTLHALPALKDNYIWMLADRRGRALVVDPGEAAPVFDAARRGLAPVAIALTHHHPDHIGGVVELRERWRLPCHAPVDPRIPDAIVDHRVGDGDRVDIPELDLQLDVLHTPGHTLSHVVFHGGGHLFCGDTLFSLGCGRLFEGTPAQMLASLDRIAALPGQLQVCGGHEYTVDNARFALTADPGNAALASRAAQAREQRATGQPTVPVSLGSEKACNPFLNAGSPGIRRSLEQHGGGPVMDRLDAFTRLRAWKDGFRA